jgi:hypothetical protein
MASGSVSPGAETPHAASVVPAPIPIAAVSVVNLAIGPEAARLLPNLRWVVMLLNPDHVAELLCKYNLSSEWNHVIVGLHNGINVGIEEPISCSCIFQQPCILSN